MATQSQSKPAPKRTARKGNGRPASRGNGSTKKATPRTRYDEKVKQVSAKARAMACPASLQGPVPKQVNDIMTVLGDPRQAVKQAGLTQAQVKKIATGDGDAESKEEAAPARREGAQGRRSAAVGAGPKPRCHLGRPD